VRDRIAAPVRPFSAGKRGCAGAAGPLQARLLTSARIDAVDPEPAAARVETDEFGDLLRPLLEWREGAGLASHALEQAGAFFHARRSDRPCSLVGGQPGNVMETTG
jgi:hypothetical protein